MLGQRSFYFKFSFFVFLSSPASLAKHTHLPDHLKLSSPQAVLLMACTRGVCVCVCVCACVCVRACACVRAVFTIVGPNLFFSVRIVGFLVGLFLIGKLF